MHTRCTRWPSPQTAVPWCQAQPMAYSVSCKSLKSLSPSFFPSLPPSLPPSTALSIYLLPFLWLHQKMYDLDISHDVFEYLHESEK